MARGAKKPDRADGRQRATQADGPSGHGAALSAGSQEPENGAGKQGRAGRSGGTPARVHRKNRPHPELGRDDLRIDLHGDLAGILSIARIASQKRVRPGKTSLSDASGPNTIALVAGGDVYGL